MYMVEHCGPFEIPAFLRAGHPDREAAIARGAAFLAADPRLKPQASEFAKIKADKVHSGQRGSKTKVTRSTRSANDRIRDQLIQLDYSKEFVATVSIAKAKQILADIIAGRGAIREDTSNAQGNP